MVILQVVAALTEAKANIQARNCYLWTPLDCAGDEFVPRSVINNSIPAAYGWVKCAAFLINVRSLKVHPHDLFGL